MAISFAVPAKPDRTLRYQLFAVGAICLILGGASIKSGFVSYGEGRTLSGTPADEQKKKKLRRAGLRAVLLGAGFLAAGAGAVLMGAGYFFPL